MDVTHRPFGSLALVDLRGPLTATVGERDFEPLRATLHALVAAGCGRVALNLADATTADARGLGELVWAFNLVTKAGGQLVLMAPNAKLRRLLASTRLDTVIPICESAAPTIERLDRSSSTSAGAGEARPPACASVCGYWQHPSDAYAAGAQ